MNLGLKNKVVIITGGSNGIGKATALAFAKEEAHVVITYYKDEAAAHELVREIGHLGGNAFAVRMDLKNHESIDKVVKEAINKHGRIDILVNNALEWRNEFSDSKMVFNRMVDDNLKGTFYITDSVIPYMKEKRWGRLVHLSSDLAQDGMAGSAAYTTCKAALHGLSKTLSKELAGNGIFSNVVLPGLTLTDRALQRFSPKFLQEFAETYPTKRIGLPEDAANLIVYLASEANSFVNGEAIRVTGGR